MNITEVRIKLMEDSEDRLRAFCSITLDQCFVIRDLKIIDGASGPFVAMPSRKLTTHCHRCGYKNHLRAAYCNQCGAKFRREFQSQYDTPQKLYADVAHPINSECRELIQAAVIAEFQAELDRAAQPGYRSRYDDEFGDCDSQSNSSPDSGRSRPESSGDPSLNLIDAPARQSPPKPHFRSSPPDQAATRDRQRNDDQDSFGAGIF